MKAAERLYDALDWLLVRYGNYVASALLLLAVGFLGWVIGQLIMLVMP